MSEELKIPYMDEFAEYLEKEDGLAPRTIKRHILNAGDFIYYMSSHGYEADPYCDEEELPMDDQLLARGPQFLHMYFSYFLPRKAFATPDSLRQSGGSVKKLYKFLAAKGIVSEKICKEILDDIKYFMPEWMEECNW